MTAKQFERLVKAWGGDENAARILHVKPRTVQALRLGERRITPRMAAFIALLQPSTTNPGEDHD